MKNSLKVITSLLLVIQCLPASAAGIKPVLDINCGQIVGGVDENGTYGLFKPDVSVRYYGSPLKITAYFYRTPATPKSETGKTIVTLTTNNSGSRQLKSKVDFERKVLEYSRPQTGYYKILFEAVDNQKRKGSFTCLYKDYFFSTPTQDSSNSGSSSRESNTRGFNKSNCTFNGKKLYGSVYITPYSSLADFSVHQTQYSTFAVVTVYETNYESLATRCGVWYFTEYSSMADFTIYLTPYSSLADFSIYYTNFESLAGIR